VRCASELGSERNELPPSERPPHVHVNFLSFLFLFLTVSRFITASCPTTRPSSSCDTRRPTCSNYILPALIASILYFFPFLYTSRLVLLDNTGTYQHQATTTRGMRQPRALSSIYFSSFLCYLHHLYSILITSTPEVALLYNNYTLTSDSPPALRGRHLVCFLFPQ
jgi:hypothetical protein